jgi:hypothetical protein
MRSGGVPKARCRRSHATRRSDRASLDRSAHSSLSPRHRTLAEHYLSRATPKPLRPRSMAGDCGRMHHEHIIPKWIDEVLPNLGKGQHRRTGAFGTDLGSWRDRAFSRKIGCTCRRCNTGWMSVLETSVKPLLAPALLGQPTTHHLEGQQVLATWAFKTALVFAAQSKDFPHWPFTYVYKHRRPPSEAKIWIGAFHAPTTTYHTYVPGFMSTFGLGCVVFHVFLSAHGETSVHGFEGELCQALLQLWPTKHEKVNWPPRLSLDPASLDDLSNGYGQVF